MRIQYFYHFDTSNQPEVMFRDPRFIREFKAKHCVEVFATHAVNKTKSGIFLFTRIELIFLSFLGGNYGDARINQSLSIRTKSKWSMATAVIPVVFNCFLTMFIMSLLTKLLCHLQRFRELIRLTTTYDSFFPPSYQIAAGVRNPMRLSSLFLIISSEIICCAWS